MKKTLLSSAALVGLTAAVAAADLPSRRAPVPYAAIPVFTWTGLYAGLNAGYGFGTGNNANGAFAVAPGAGASLTGPLAAYTGVVTPGGGGNGRDGFVGGGQIGYNYQIANFVLGVETDIQYADLGGRRTGTTFITPGVAGFFGATNNNLGGIDWYGTLRGRVGYAWDRLLVYGTGGFAYGDGPNNNCNVAVLGFVGCGNNNGIRTGYAAGGGLEYAFTPNLTGRVEAQYVDLGRRGVNNFVGAVAAPGGAVPVFATGRRTQDDDFVVVRAGVNYKFNLF